MPKYKKETAKRRAKKLTKTFIKNDCNQTKTAEELGITSQAVNQQIHSPIVQKTFQEVMEKAGITDERCADKMDEGFDCDRAIVVDKSIKYVPVQLCPKCNGDGNVFTNYIHGSSSITSSGTVTCNLCNGTMVIPQQQVS